MQLIKSRFGCCYLKRQAYFDILCGIFLKKCEKSLRTVKRAPMINMSFFFPYKHKLITFNSFDVSFSSWDESKDTETSAGNRPFGELFVAHYRLISVHEAHDAPRRKMKDSQNFGRC